VFQIVLKNSKICWLIVKIQTYGLVNIEIEN